MLAGCCRGLLAISDHVSVMARDEARIRAIAPEVIPRVCDYNDAAAVAAALNGIQSDLIVAWIHGAMPEPRRALAQRVRPGGRFVQVLGSAHGDPSHPDRLERAKAAVAGLSIAYQAVVLGFVRDGAASRWLTDDEISSGVLDAIASGAPLTIVGTVEPWSARP